MHTNNDYQNDLSQTRWKNDIPRLSYDLYVHTHPSSKTRIGTHIHSLVCIHTYIHTQSNTILNQDCEFLLSFSERHILS